jgi:hypothetical protein
MPGASRIRLDDWNNSGCAEQWSVQIIHPCRGLPWQARPFPTKRFWKRETPTDSYPVRPSRLGEAFHVSPRLKPRATPETRLAISNHFAVTTIVALRATAGHGGTRATTRKSSQPD